MLPRLSPQAVGRYEVVAQLGEGGMARVFLAIQRNAFAAEKLVVIKQVRPELVADTEFLAMFMNEARIALQLHHPNVVHTYEVVGEAPQYFLAMEYLEGQPLSAILRKMGREGFPVDLHLWILSQALAGLHYAHELRDLDGTALGIVHRDVSPSNVFITSSGEVKLLDFGIAKAAGAVSFTQQGMMKGKLGYAAPEQCLARPLDARADIFSMGVMLWEALAGQRRRSGEGSLATLHARVTDREPTIEAVVPGIEPRLAAICGRALAHSPDDRYHSASELKADLDSYLEGQSVRPWGPRVAELMTALFAEELTGLRARIEAQVQDGRRASGKIALESQRTPAGAALPRLPVSTSPARAPRKRTATILVGAGLTAGAVALLPWLTTTEPRLTQRELTQPAPQTAPAASSQVESESESESEAKPEVAALVSAPVGVRVNWAATPAEARMWLDGKPIPNPFTAELPLGDHELKLEVSAPGYRSVRRRLVASRAPSIDIALVREARSEHRSARPAPASSPPSSPPTPTAEDATPPVRAAALAPPTSPGQELVSPPHVARPIDDKDPYQ